MRRLGLVRCASPTGHDVAQHGAGMSGVLDSGMASRLQASARRGSSPATWRRNASASSPPRRWAPRRPNEPHASSASRLPGVPWPSLSPAPLMIRGERGVARPLGRYRTGQTCRTGPTALWRASRLRAGTRQAASRTATSPEGTTGFGRRLQPTDGGIHPTQSRRDGRAPLGPRACVVPSGLLVLTARTWYVVPP